MPPDFLADILGLTSLSRFIFSLDSLKATFEMANTALVDNCNTNDPKPGSITTNVSQACAGQASLNRRQLTDIDSGLDDHGHATQGYWSWEESTKEFVFMEEKDRARRIADADEFHQPSSTVCQQPKERLGEFRNTYASRDHARYHPSRVPFNTPTTPAISRFANVADPLSLPGGILDSSLPSRLTSFPFDLESEEGAGREDDTFSTESTSESGLTFSFNDGDVSFASETETSEDGGTLSFLNFDIAPVMTSSPNSKRVGLGISGVYKKNHDGDDIAFDGLGHVCVRPSPWRTSGSPPSDFTYFNIDPTNVKSNLGTSASRRELSSLPSLSSTFLEEALLTFALADDPLYAGHALASIPECESWYEVDELARQLRGEVPAVVVDDSDDMHHPPSNAIPPTSSSSSGHPLRRLDSNLKYPSVGNADVQLGEKAAAAVGSTPERKYKLRRNVSASTISSELKRTNSSSSSAFPTTRLLSSSPKRGGSKSLAQASNGPPSHSVFKFPTPAHSQTSPSPLARGRPATHPPRAHTPACLMYSGPPLRGPGRGSGVNGLNGTGTPLTARVGSRSEQGGSRAPRWRF